MVHRINTALTETTDTVPEYLNSPNITEQRNQVLFLRCFAHVLQLAVRAGLRKCEFLDNAIGYFRDLAKAISDSPKCVEALSRVCSALSVPCRKRVLDVPTRWNSTWEMISVIIQLKLGITELL
jgi:hypothetical protein